MARRSDYHRSRPVQPSSPSIETAKHLSTVARHFVAGTAGHWEVEEAYRLWEDAVRAERAQKREKP